MLVFKKKKALKEHLLLFKGTQIGFVPTMGALHQGHLSLVNESKKNNAITVVSIFVNPTQFDNLEDLKKYPKTLEKDLDILEKTACDVVFIPDVKEMYTQHVQSKSYAFDGLENQMEGKFRVGHFNGVATIVQAFFEIVQPTNAYFGEKDFQQLQIVKKLVEKEQLSVQVIGCPISREKDGLAMSSRNVRLTKSARKAAPFIYQTLLKVKQQAIQKNINELTQFVEKEFNTQPLLQLEYFTIAQETNLTTPSLLNLKEKNRAFIAVNAGNIRLIDNLALY